MKDDEAAARAAVIIVPASKAILAARAAGKFVWIDKAGAVRASDPPKKGPKK